MNRDMTLDLSDMDILLASKCNNSSTTIHPSIEQVLVSKIGSLKINSSDYISTLIELHKHNLISPSTKSLQIILSLKDYIENSDIILFLSFWLEKKIHITTVLHKKDLRLFNLIMEELNSQEVDKGIFYLLDLIFENTKRVINNLNILGVDVIIRSFYLFKKFEYRKAEYSYLVLPFLNRKKSRKKNKIYDNIQLSAKIYKASNSQSISL